MYFICDVYDNSNCGKVKSYKELKDLLISEVIDDLKNNRQDFDIVISCTDMLEILAKGKESEKYIIDNLEGYGWKIIDLIQIQRDLEDLKAFYAPNEDSKLAVNFQNVLDTINKGMNK